MGQQLPVSAGAVSLAVSSVEVASMPWAFTQHQPPGTSEFITESERRARHGSQWRRVITHSPGAAHGDDQLGGLAGT